MHQGIFHAKPDSRVVYKLPRYERCASDAMVPRLPNPLADFRMTLDQVVTAAQDRRNGIGNSFEDGRVVKKLMQLLDSSI